MPATTLTANRCPIVCCAVFLLLATAGCQRKAPNAADTATAAASQDEPPEGVLRAYVWQCSDGQTLVMRNLFREQAIAIDFHDGTRRLDQTPAASGARYADPVVVFWTKGSTATLERQGAPAAECEERRAESLREDARLRGVADPNR